MESFEVNFAQHPVATQRSQRTEIHIESIPAQKRTVVVLESHIEILKNEREGVRIHTDFSDGDGAAQRGGARFSSCDFRIMGRMKNPVIVKTTRAAAVIQRLRRKRVD